MLVRKDSPIRFWIGLTMLALLLGICLTAGGAFAFASVSLPIRGTASVQGSSDSSGKANPLATPTPCNSITVSGSITTTDSTQTGRMARNGITSCSQAVLSV